MDVLDQRREILQNDNSFASGEKHEFLYIVVMNFDKILESWLLHASAVVQFK